MSLKERLRRKVEETAISFLLDRFLKVFRWLLYLMVNAISIVEIVNSLYWFFHSGLKFVYVVYLTIFIATSIIGWIGFYNEKKE